MIYKSSVLDNCYYSISIDLELDLQQYSKKIIQNNGFICDNKEDWIRLYFNMQKRIIPNIPRAIVKSAEFVCPAEYRQALEEIEEKILTGNNLIPYMSDKILNLKYKDLLLYDWNIYHLHLSRRKRPDGFIKRSDYELFLYVTDKTIYFIQIYPHSKEYLYSTQEMVRIIHNNWPDLISRYKITGAICGTEKITDKMYEMLRKNGVSACVDLGNETLYMSFGGGYASDGSSLEVTRNSQYWKSIMKQYQHLVVREVHGIIKAIYQLGNKKVNCNLDFSMICFTDDGITLFESNNGVCLQLFRTKGFCRICYPKDLFIDEISHSVCERHLLLKG